MNNQKFVVEIKGKTIPICSLEEHDAQIKAELLDKVAKVVKNRIDSYNPSYTDIYNVITELSDVVLNSIAEIKGDAAE